MMAVFIGFDGVPAFGVPIGSAGSDDCIFCCLMYPFACEESNCSILKCGWLTCLCSAYCKLWKFNCTRKANHWACYPVGCCVDVLLIIFAPIWFIIETLFWLICILVLFALNLMVCCIPACIFGGTWLFLECWL